MLHFYQLLNSAFDSQEVLKVHYSILNQLNSLELSFRIQDVLKYYEMELYSPQYNMEYFLVQLLIYSHLSHNSEMTLGKFP